MRYTGLASIRPEQKKEQTAEGNHFQPFTPSCGSVSSVHGEGVNSSNSGGFPVFRSSSLCRTRLGEDEGRVEDVEALVLHRPHVEIVYGHHVEDVQVVLQPKLVLVPLHGGLQKQFENPMHTSFEIHIVPQKSVVTSRTYSPHACDVMVNGRLRMACGVLTFGYHVKLR